jgi:hypothetical protein
MPRARVLLAVGAVTLGLFGSHLGVAQAAAELERGADTSPTTGVAVTDPVTDEVSLGLAEADEDPDAVPSAEELALGTVSTVEEPEEAPGTAEHGERVGLAAGQKAACDERVKDVAETSGAQFAACAASARRCLSDHVRSQSMRATRVTACRSTASAMAGSTRGGRTAWRCASMTRQ